MAPNRIGTVAQAWYQWKALRLPWRKRFLMGKQSIFSPGLQLLARLPACLPAPSDPKPLTYMAGYDLEGNTYWEFRLTRGTEGGERWRRIVNYPRSTHYSQVKVNPQWHQWLRHTRREPPTLDELQGDVVRQARIKVLAAEADARWEAKPRVMEAPETTAQRLASVNAPAPPARDARRRKPVDGESETEKSDDPWAKAAKAQGPGENWQPAAWDPAAVKKSSS
ncbi:hypothetical protein AK830_g3056 [Neonectria ditissima]|uniref:Uncharacterized protein n=1 Tax=Neonectria ditissima TaxID=78410 RepID=A0A0P7BQ42_9HYPO|nr:hypothetical protein AK830_g3056 [Neonectria ditissima]